MTISELIENLQKKQELYGDLPVHYACYDYYIDDWFIRQIDEISIEDGRVVLS